MVRGEKGQGPGGGGRRSSGDAGPHGGGGRATAPPPPLTRRPAAAEAPRQLPPRTVATPRTTTAAAPHLRTCPSTWGPPSPPPRGAASRASAATRGNGRGGHRAPCRTGGLQQSVEEGGGGSEVGRPPVRAATGWSVRPLRAPLAASVGSPCHPLPSAGERSSPPFLSLPPHKLRATPPSPHPPHRRPHMLCMSKIGTWPPARPPSPGPPLDPDRPHRQRAIRATIHNRHGACGGSPSSPRPAGPPYSRRTKQRRPGEADDSYIPRSVSGGGRGTTLRGRFSVGRRDLAAYKDWCRARTLWGYRTT